LPAASGDGPVSAALRRLVEAGALDADARQGEAAALLDGVAEGLAAQRGGLLRRWGRSSPPPKGVYLHGRVGRGKTLLMDLFYSALDIRDKRRLHFHEFMDEMHSAIAAIRAASAGRKGRVDPVLEAIPPVLGRTRLICLDEFRVDDITNAMLLGRLFERLFAQGVVLVATSNVAPDDLYENGLNRQLFLPFLDLLKDNVTVFTLDGPTDYRQLKFEGQQVFHIGTGPAAKAAMDALWARLTGGVAGRRETVSSLGRAIEVPEAAMGVARFPAAELIEKPLGARDYLRLAHAYDALILDNVPQFDRTRSSAAKRFILLLDALYDAGVKLGASFAVPIAELGADDKTAAEFARAASRLAEMQSAEYLAAPRHSPGPDFRGGESRVDQSGGGAS
jgi:cell division protein ZapE